MPGRISGATWPPSVSPATSCPCKPGFPVGLCSCLSFPLALAFPRSLTLFCYMGFRRRHSGSELLPLAWGGALAPESPLLTPMGTLMDSTPFTWRQVPGPDSRLLGEPRPGSPTLAT